MAQASQRGFDAGREHLGAVYAQALLGASQKQGNTAQVMAELDSLVVDLFEKMPTFHDVLSSPKVKLEDKERLIDRALAGKASGVLINGLKIMARHGRIDVIDDVRHAFRKLFNELQGRVEVEVRSAAQLDEASLQAIAQQLRMRLGKDVDLNVKIEPELLGGVVVRVGDTLLDGSVRTKLHNMRQSALKATEQSLRSTFDRFVVA